jgi:ribosomal protein L37AE/L43A
MNNGELMQYSPGRTLTPVMNIDLAKSRLAEFQNFIKEYMREGEDYGLIPGTNKKSLWKPGADKLCEIYGLSDSYRIIDRLVDFDRGLFDYEIECTLSRDGMVIATGLGSCSSFEGKYRWRDSKRVCPQCGKDTIAKSKDEYGGGWYCNAKFGGCGAKFEKGDASIEQQETGRVENDDIATLKNTILKMSKKRAKIDATLSATRSAGVFTQDIGDDEGKGKDKKPPITAPQRKQPENQGAETTHTDTISEPQQKRFHAISANAHYSKEQAKAVLEAAGYTSTADILKKHYQTICEFIEGTPVEQIEATLPTLTDWCSKN